MQMKQYPSKVTTKYQAVIPQEVREILGISQGDYVVFEVDDYKKVSVKKGKIKIEVEG